MGEVPVDELDRLVWERYFAPKGSELRAEICRKIQIMRATRWNAANRDRAKQIRKEYDRRHPDKLKAKQERYRQSPRAKRVSFSSYLKRTYGITVAEYDVMFAAQGYACAICRTQEPPAGARPWHLDHDHDNKMLRSILCRHCNLGLGHVQDNCDTLRAMITYLEHHKVRLS